MLYIITSKKSTWNFTNSSNKWREWRTVLFFICFHLKHKPKKNTLFVNSISLHFKLCFLTAFTHVFTTPTPPLTIYAAHNICLFMNFFTAIRICFRFLGFITGKKNILFKFELLLQFWSLYSCGLLLLLAVVSSKTTTVVVAFKIANSFMAKLTLVTTPESSGFSVRKK